ncbi:putative beta-catenin-like protein 1 [Naematelia encephala]|uniref:Putative beta-catenin-like protein 1 n=1 Tax=Naematelia encephala TaxID=71784 RepID=A0A1Y2B7M2_9TREE|nr:putative beta-catenin-like protein 1 [Naematelia encephala]
MDVDKMFKLPALPASAGQKRKFTDKPSPEMLKKYKPDEEQVLMPPPPVPVNGKAKTQAASVSEEDEDTREYSRGEADDDFDMGDGDDDGRFFGGGLNSEQQEILDIFDKAGDDENGETTALTLPALRRQLGKFERIVAKNAEQRGKFPDDPSKFIESEADLDSAVKQFLPLTQNPPAYYPELVKSGVIALLCNLLSHENTDIAIDVIEVIQELTDEDVGAEVDDLEAEEAEGSSGGGIATKTRIVMADLIDDLLNNSILDLLVANLSRLNEAEDSDSQGVFHILGVFENLLSFMPPLADQIVNDTSLMPWLVKRIVVKEYDANKQYASEILAILVQQGRDIVMKLGELDGMDTLLRVLSQYRKKDPGDSEEVEFMENVFDILCTALAEPEMKAAFLEAEGVELMIIMMKEKLLARTRAIKVLDYAMQTEDGSGACERFVEMLGLKTFFSAFMGKGEPKKRKLGATSAVEDEEHLLGILVSLFTNLASDTPARIRLIAKFVEGNYEKIERLLEMREAAEGRLRAVNRDINMERRVMEANKEEIGEEEEAEWYLRRMDAGLSALQNADYVLAWMCQEDDGAMLHARVLLMRKDQSFKNVIDVLTEFKNNIGDEPEENENGQVEEETNVQRLIIGELISFLERAG